MDPASQEYKYLCSEIQISVQDFKLDSQSLEDPALRKVASDLKQFKEAVHKRTEHIVDDIKIR